MKQIAAAIVGLGWWGRTIAGLLQGNRKLAVACAVDVNPAAGDFAAGLKIPFRTNFESVLSDPAIEAVILCTPHSQHCEQIVQAARAKKHVFCEKPFCMSVAEVTRALEAVNAAGVTVGVGHERRFEAPVAELMRLADSGALGTLVQVEGNFSQDKFIGLAADNWRLSAKEAPAGPLTATGIHMLDLAIRFLGPGESVLARVRTLGSSLPNGDTLGALMTHRSGANALISAILTTPFVGRFAVYGSQGWAEVWDKNHPESPQGWTVRTKLRGGELQTREYAPMPAVLANLEAFADAVLGGAPYAVPQAQIRATVCALEAVIRSASSGRIETIAG